MGFPSLQIIAMWVIAFVVAITVHEYAHARAALSAGDDTAKQAGRISLNPMDHLDPVGTILPAMLILSGSSYVFGWGKPVPVNPYRFSSPRWDSLRISLWGPLSNVITAFALSVILKFVLIPTGMLTPQYYHLISICITLNLVLAFFNLIPVAPLDGSKILSALLPVDQARRYDLMMAQYGLLILIVIILTRTTRLLIGPPVDFLTGVLIPKIYFIGSMPIWQL